MNAEYYLKTKKENLINKCQSEYDRYGKLLEYYDMFKETLKEFDGKVYNKRFRDALSKKINNDKVFVSEESQHLYYNTDSYIDICVKVYPIGSYTDEVSMTMRICCDINKRINAEASLTHKYEEPWRNNIKSNMESLKDTIENYDTYKEKAEQLRKEIDEFNHNIPYPFRHNIIESYFRLYCG